MSLIHAQHSERLTKIQRKAEVLGMPLKEISGFWLEPVLQQHTWPPKKSPMKYPQYTNHTTGKLLQQPQQSQFQQKIRPKNTVKHKPDWKDPTNKPNLIGKLRQRGAKQHAIMRARRKNQQKRVPLMDILAVVEPHLKKEAMVRQMHQKIFSNKNLKLNELIDVVEAVSVCQMELQVHAAALLIKYGFYFAAIKATYGTKIVLREVLREVLLMVAATLDQDDWIASADTWVWDSVDQEMFMQQFQKLPVIQHYKTVKSHLDRLGFHGHCAIARVEREVMLKVVSDFQEQLDPRLIAQQTSLAIELMEEDIGTPSGMRAGPSTPGLVEAAGNSALVLTSMSNSKGIQIDRQDFQNSRGFQVTPPHVSSRIQASPLLSRKGVQALAPVSTRPTQATPNSKEISIQAASRQRTKSGQAKPQVQHATNTAELKPQGWGKGVMADLRPQSAGKGVTADIRPQTDGKGVMARPPSRDQKVGIQPEIPDTFNASVQARPHSRNADIQTGNQNQSRSSKQNQVQLEYKLVEPIEVQVQFGVLSGENPVRVYINAIDYVQVFLKEVQAQVPGGDDDDVESLKKSLNDMSNLLQQERKSRSNLNSAGRKQEKEEKEQELKQLQEMLQTQTSKEQQALQKLNELHQKYEQREAEYQAEKEKLQQEVEKQIKKFQEKLEGDQERAKLEDQGQQGEQKKENSGQGQGYEEEEAPSAAEVIAYAEYLGMDLEQDEDLLFVAEWALMAPLPEGWTSHLDGEDNEFFYNAITGETQYEHPMDQKYREYYYELREKKQKLLNSR